LRRKIDNDGDVVETRVLRRLDSPLTTGPQRLAAATTLDFRMKPLIYACGVTGRWGSLGFVLHRLLSDV